MLSTPKSSTHRALNLSRRLRSRLRLEELESRTLLSIYSPAQINHAYGTDQIAFASGAVKGDGSGETIAIVDAYYDSTIQSDLNTFSTRYGLSQLDGQNGDGQFTQIDLSHKTPSPANDDWTVETALDVEWAHAVAPKANIALVEAASDNSDANTGEPTDLLNAVHTAATTPGVVAVSMSWGISEVPQETKWDSFFSTPGVTFFAASGDSGAGTIWPAVSPNVVAVGGTSLKLTSSNTISSETGWGNGNYSAYFGGSGGGFSTYESLPSYQAIKSGISTAYTQYGVRLSPDVAYDADPNTGYAVYDGTDGGWFQVGGTSAGAPQWAGLMAIADQGRALNGLTPLSSTQTLRILYNNRADFHDITQGSTGTYEVVDSSGNVVGQIPVTAGTGYDLVAGLGSPKANLLVARLAVVGSSTSATTTAIAPVTSNTGSESNTHSTPPTGSGSSHSHGSQDQGSNSSSSTPTAVATLPTTGVLFTIGVPVQPGSVPQIAAPAVVQPTASTPPSPVPAVAEGSGGGDNAMLTDDSNATDMPAINTAPATPAISVPTAPPQRVPVTPKPADRSTTPPPAPVPLPVRDAVFAEPQQTVMATDNESAPAEESLLQRAGDPLTAAVGLALALVGSWSVQSRKAEESERRHVNLHNPFEAR
jgi:subtilase family serine protease